MSRAAVVDVVARAGLWLAAMIAPLALMVLAATTVPLADGPYRVVYDRVETRELEWDVACVAPPVPTTLEQGARFTARVDGDAFTFTAGDAAPDGGTARGAPPRTVGTAACDAETGTVVVTSVTRGLAEVRVRCQTARVVRGTEEGETVYRFRDDGGVELRTRMTRRWRTAGASCGLQRLRATLLDPVPRTGRVEEIVAAAARQSAYTELRVTHHNAMPAPFELVSAQYFLDTRAVLKDEIEPEWGPLPIGGTRPVFSGLITQGPHVLAAELVYEAPGPSRALRVRVRDTIFFDALERSIAIAIVGEESDVVFAELEDRTRVRFEVSGAMNVTKDERGR